MKTPVEIIENLLQETGLATDMKENELQEATFLLSVDLNQFILEKLFAMLGDDEIILIDDLLRKDDQIGIAAVFDALGQKPHVAEIIEAAVSEYVKNISSDLKSIAKIIKKKQVKRRDI